MNKDEQEIRGLVRQWAHASTAGDYLALEQMMHPGVVFLTPGNEPMTIDAFRESFLNVVKSMHLECEADTREVEVSGVLAYAWNWISVRLRGASEDVVVSREGYSLSVYKRDDQERWKLWRDANLIARQPS